MEPSTLEWRSGPLPPPRRGGQIVVCGNWLGHPHFFSADAVFPGEPDLGLPSGLRRTAISGDVNCPAWRKRAGLSVVRDSDVAFWAQVN